MLKQAGGGYGLSIFRKLRGAGFEDPVQQALAGANVDLGKAYDAQMRGRVLKDYARRLRAEQRKKEAMSPALIRLCTKLAMPRLSGMAKVPGMPKVPGMRPPSIGGAVTGAKVLKRPPSLTGAVNPRRNITQAMTAQTNMISR